MTVLDVEVRLLLLLAWVCLRLRLYGPSFALIAHAERLERLIDA